GSASPWSARRGRGRLRSGPAGTGGRRSSSSSSWRCWCCWSRPERRGRANAGEDGGGWGPAAVGVVGSAAGEGEGEASGAGSEALAVAVASAAAVPEGVFDDGETDLGGRLCEAARCRPWRAAGVAAAVRLRGARHACGGALRRQHAADLRRGG